MGAGVNLYGLGELASGELLWNTAKELAEFGYQKLEPMILFACDLDRLEHYQSFIPCIWGQDGLEETCRKLEELYGLAVTSCHFAGMEGEEQMVIDYFLKLSPDTMLQADLGWTMFSGKAETAFLREHLDRTALIHLKDFQKDFSVSRREKDLVAVGEGQLDLEAIIQIAKQAGLAENALIVDQDCSQKDLMEDLRKGIKNIEKRMELRVQSPGL